MQVLRGNKIVEVRASGVNKGQIGLHVAGLVSPNMIFAAGDDWTDEDMFRGLPSDAVTVKVGFAKTQARFTVHTSRDMVRLLGRFVNGG